MILTWEEHPYSIGTGQCTMVFGPSDSGKSALLWELFRGSDLVSQSVDELDEDSCLLRQHVGPSFWRSTLLEEIEASSLASSSLSQEEKEMVLQVIPKSWLGKAPWELSHGQLRYFGALCLLLQKPRVLYLDQPFQGLDGFLKLSLRKLLNSFLERGLSLFLTTHEPKELESFQGLTISLEAKRSPLV